MATLSSYHAYLSLPVEEQQHGADCLHVLRQCQDCPQLCRHLPSGPFSSQVLTCLSRHPINSSDSFSPLFSLWVPSRPISYRKIMPSRRTFPPALRFSLAQSTARPHLRPFGSSYCLVEISCTRSQEVLRSSLSSVETAPIHDSCFLKPRCPLITTIF